MSASTPVYHAERRRPWGRIIIHTFITLTAAIWLVPIAGALYASLRPLFRHRSRWILRLARIADARQLSQRVGSGRYPPKILEYRPDSLSRTALNRSGFRAWSRSFCTRYSWRFNIFTLLCLYGREPLAATVIIQPLFQIYNRIPLPDFLSNSGKLNGST
ncbi:MAG: hypothetical protein R2845_12075 [Thermomicrobiales bacterium]